MQTSSPFLPAGPEGAAIAQLFAAILVIAGIIFVIVTGLVLYISFRYRSRSDSGEPTPNFGSNRMEVLWTVGPAILLVGVFTLTVGTIRALTPPPQTETQPDVIVIGHQWWWEVKYPATGVTTANEIHIPAGKRLLFQVGTADVIHSFWVPQLGRKMDMIPGRMNYVWYQVDEPGVYLGTCSEYCGAQHAWMRIRVVAQTQEEFDAWQQQQAQPASTPTSALAQEGQQLFQQLTCVNCHTIQGTPANAVVGPDLTHVASRSTLASGVLENTPQNLASWLADPQSIKPGIRMPNLQLTGPQIGALVTYLETLQ